MQKERLCYIGAVLLGAAWLVTPPGRTQARRPHLSMNFEGTADRCSDLRVSSTGEIARSEETFTLTKGESPSLELYAPERGIIRVRGWERPDYSVNACKIAVAEDRATADQLLKSIAISRNAGRFSYTGSATDAGEWQVYFIVHTPKDATLDLETKNGPISVEQVSGTIKARSSNGPVAVRDSSGAIEIRTVNGPIAFSGGGGDVQLNAQNGPISLKPTEDVWNGTRLAAATSNGPVSVVLPERFRSGVRVETSAHTPISCRAGACNGASTNSASGRLTLQMNGSGDTVRVTTEHGPVSVRGGGKSPKVI
jgi:hypothetical protein